MKDQKFPAHETLQAGILLATVGGFLDAFTYLLRGGVFANAQTGNMVLLGIHLTKRDLGQAIYYFFPILAFFAGILLTAWIKKTFSEVEWVHWHSLILILELIILFIIGFLPLSVSDSVVNITISFICSMQVCCFKKLKGSAYATTMCTGNLRSGTEQLFLWISDKNKEAGKQAGRYFLIILCFCMGAVIGALTIPIWKEKSIWICCVILLIVWWMLHQNQKKRSES